MICALWVTVGIASFALGWTIAMCIGYFLVRHMEEGEN